MYLYILDYPKKDNPVSKLSTRITPSYGSTKFKPFTAKFPPKSTTSTRNISGGTIKDNKPGFSTQSTTSPSNFISFSCTYRYKCTKLINTRRNILLYYASMILFTEFNSSDIF